jgi:hypothetical protein
MRSFWSNVIRRLSVARELAGRGDPLLTLHIILFAAAVPALLRLKIARLQSLLERAGIATAANPARVQKVISRVESVLQLGGPLYRRKCLSRGLTLFYFLRKEGVDVTLCFGMGKVAGEFEGHCWLVKDGEPFLEAEDPRSFFTAIHSIPRSPQLYQGSRADEGEQLHGDQLHGDQTC